MKPGEGLAQAPSPGTGRRARSGGLKPFTDPRTGKAVRAVDRVAFAVATPRGGG